MNIASCSQKCPQAAEHKAQLLELMMHEIDALKITNANTEQVRVDCKLNPVPSLLHFEYSIWLNPLILSLLVCCQIDHSMLLPVLSLFS